MRQGTQKRKQKNKRKKEKDHKGEHEWSSQKGFFGVAFAHALTPRAIASRGGSTRLRGWKSAESRRYRSVRVKPTREPLTVFFFPSNFIIIIILHSPSFFSNFLLFFNLLLFFKFLLLFSACIILSFFFLFLPFPSFFNLLLFLLLLFLFRVLPAHSPDYLAHSPR